MKQIALLLIIAISGLAACQNKQKAKGAGSAAATGDTISIADTLTYKYDSVKVYSQNPVSANKQVTDTAKATFTYPVFSDAKWNVMIEKDALQTSNPDDREYTSYKDLATSFIKQFDDFKKENKDSFHTWFKDVDILVLPQRKNYLALKYTFFEYMGGAHPNTMVVYKNYNANEQKLIALEDIIKQGKKAELTAIAGKIFRKSEGLKDNESLKDEYFFENNTFALNDNFYLKPEGIQFLYNAYEIRAYAYGRTELFIPYASIKHILKANPVLPVLE